MRLDLSGLLTISLIAVILQGIHPVLGVSRRLMQPSVDERLKRSPLSFEPSVDERLKRSPLSFVKAALEGIQASQTLLKETTKTTGGRYIKSGTYRQAIKDFGSVKPTHVRSLILADGVGRIGMIGNRAIVIKSVSETGYPVLKIFKPTWTTLRKDSNAEIAYEIIYKKY